MAPKKNKPGIQNQRPDQPGFEPYTGLTKTNGRRFIDSMDRRQMKQGLWGPRYEGAAPLTGQQAADKRADLKKRSGRGELTDEEYAQARRVIRERRIAGMDRRARLAGPAYERGRPLAPRFPQPQGPAATPIKKKPAVRSSVPDATQSMPADRMRYHRNSNVSLAPDTAGNRYFGNVGRVIDPSGRPLEGASGDVVRKGYPTEAPYSGNLRSKIGLAGVQALDANERVYNTVMGKQPPARTPKAPARAPKPATNAPGAVASRSAPRNGPTMQQTMDSMGNSPGYEPFPAKKKRR